MDTQYDDGILKKPQKKAQNNNHLLLVKWNKTKKYSFY